MSAQATVEPIWTPVWPVGSQGASKGGVWIDKDIQQAYHDAQTPAEHIRNGTVTSKVGESGGVTDRSVIFNLGNSGDSDVASDKDAMVAEAFAAELDKSSKDQ